MWQISTELSYDEFCATIAQLAQFHYRVMVISPTHRSLLVKIESLSDITMKLFLILTGVIYIRTPMYWTGVSLQVDQDGMADVLLASYSEELFQRERNYRTLYSERPDCIIQIVFGYGLITDTPPNSESPVYMPNLT